MTKKIIDEAVDGVKERHLWILTKKEKVGRKMVTAGYTYFFVCECSNMPQSIDEDQFLCRKDLLCEKCEWSGRATFSWKRKLVQPERKVIST